MSRKKKSAKTTRVLISGKKKLELVANVVLSVIDCLCVLQGEDWKTWQKRQEGWVPPDSSSSSSRNYLSSMGCVQSQSNGQTSKDKGAASVIGDNNGQGGASAAQVDPRLPLNARQKYSMLASWKGISRALEPTGVYMFIKLFEEHKELLSLFTKFHQLTTRDEQANSEELAEHASSVMSTLDESIRSLDNVDTFLLYLHQVGQSHYKIEGFQKEYFWKIRNPFLEAVKMTLGDRYTENIENIYKVSINLVIETLVEGYEKAQQQQRQAAPSS